MDLLFEVYGHLPRQGPGSADATRQAYAHLAALPPDARILDVGCGAGAQTAVLAALNGGTVVAVDLHLSFLTGLARRVAAAGGRATVHAVNASMDTLPFSGPHFDLIWAEGAIYIMGFERGLREWRPLLKPGGYLVVSEVSWLKPGPPEELAAFWAAEYPAIKSVDANLRALEAAGYEYVHHFVLPEQAWWDDYYTPLEQRLPALRARFEGNPYGQALLDDLEREIALFRRYCAWYGYVFYLARCSRSE